MNSYSSLSIIALLCYLVLLLAMIASQKTKLIKSFMLVLITMILWTGGSFIMRSEINQLFTIGFHISILGLCLLPYTLYCFFANYLFSDQVYRANVLLAFFLMLFFINVATGFFLSAPIASVLDNGESVYVYKVTIGSYIFCATFVVFVVFALVRLYKIIRTTKANVKELYPIFVGIACLLLGNILVLLPVFNGFPIDIVAGVVNALLFFYALYRRRLFKLTLLVSRANCYIIAAIATVVIFSYMIIPIQRIIYQWTGLDSKYSVLIVSICFSIVTIVLYYLFKKFIDQIFIKDETKQAESLKEFSYNVSKTLKIDEIVNHMATIVNDTIATHDLYICLKDEHNVCQMVYGSSLFTARSHRFHKDNPLILKLQHSDEVVLYSEFKHSISYRSMWDSEKESFDNLRVEIIVPIRSDHLIGMIMLGKKSNNHHYNYSETNFLISVAAIGAIALENSRMYEKVYLEARSDELTGLINRKYFYEQLHLDYQQYKDKALTLILMSVDDMRLYNQLYGNKEGDVALKKIAYIMCSYVGEQGCVARLGGKEFAILLPLYNVMEAKVLAESIREEIVNMNKQKEAYTLKVVSASFGISSIPFLASNVNQLVDYANQALYQAKHNGKNCVVIYNEQVSEQYQEGEEKTKKQKESIYSAYASTIYALTAAIDAKDHYTFTHSSNVAYYATQLAYAYGFNEELLEIIKEAALLHDIGKIAVPEHILNKNGKLTKEEYQTMKSHVEASIGIIRHLPSLDYVIPAVLSHHERYDGKGYPRGIKGEDIPVMGRILCIADSFDAITSSRSYKDAYSLTYAIDELEQNKGTQFDPKLVDVFIQLIHEGKIDIQGNQKTESVKL
ncbi:MAG: diguanylate cyclase [Erysipelotrichia bacterium]|nr:diguanylate cyclase [Erysipelotrichia bacterium]NCC54002.1 diguanylate cyclase [Erysipelotrichia bacterium]